MRINAATYRTFRTEVPGSYDRPTAGGTVWNGPASRLR